MLSPSFVNQGTVCFQALVIEECFPFFEIKTNKRYRALHQHFSDGPWQGTSVSATPESGDWRPSCGSARCSSCAGGQLRPGHKVGTSASTNCALTTDQRKGSKSSTCFGAASAWPQTLAWTLPFGP